MNLHPIVLCGGSGTRLWPLSRKSFPKQFVPLIAGKSLLQLTLERLAPLCSAGQGVMLVAAEEHRFMAADALRAAQAQGSVILEPAARNTAAAMALAALQVIRDQASAGGAPSDAVADPLLLFCPADHHIPDIASFARTVHQGVAAAQQGAIVTFGVVPSFPSTAYGYIEQGAAQGNGSHEVARFIEKPAFAAAQALMLQGGVLWNAGIFLTRASTLLKALDQHAPDVLASCQAAMAGASQELTQSGFQGGVRFIRPEPAAFKACRSQSIDYAVMEHLRAPHVAVVPFAGQWSDVGSWNAVADLSVPDSDDNRIEGQGLVHGSRNTFIHAPHRPVVALGTHDLLIIDTPDAVLVAHRDHAEQVKDVVSQLEARNISQAADHRNVARPWGSYDSVDAGERFQVKRITVNPGASLSLQMHHHRAEHWIVVQGTAEVTCGSMTLLLTENQSTYIPLGETHRLANPGSIPLELIEVQSGSYLGEDDIVRFEDNYGRLSVEAVDK